MPPHEQRRANDDVLTELHMIASSALAEVNKLTPEVNNIHVLLEKVNGKFDLAEERDRQRNEAIAELNRRMDRITAGAITIAVAMAVYFFQSLVTIGPHVTK